ncbi:MAG: sulfatase [bacterium]
MTGRHLALLAALCLMAGPGAAEGPAASRRANVLLISLDTLRADRLGAWGYDRETSPALDAFAKTAVRFDRAYSETCWTLPAHLSLFTGLPPSSHGVLDADRALPESVPLLAELLKSDGYRTFAITDGGYVDSFFGFGRGFDRYDEREKDLRSTLFLARNFLKTVKDDERFFLFLHTYDIHCPYDPPADYAERFRTRPPADRLDVAGKCGNPDYNGMTLTPGQIRFLSDQYDAGIRAADDLLGEFFAHLEADEWLKDTIVIVVSDHGEQFGEHGKIGHGDSLYREELHVPLLVRAPGVAPRVSSHAVGLVDVMPTVLDLVGLGIPDVQGESLVPVMTGRVADDPARPLFSELDRVRHLRSVVESSAHLIVDRDAGTMAVYHWRTDPTEQTPSSDPGLTAPLRAKLDEHERTLVRPETVPAAPLDPAQVERLRALGYVE